MEIRGRTSWWHVAARPHPVLRSGLAASRGLGDGQFQQVETLLDGESVERAVAVDLDLDGRPRHCFVGGTGDVTIQLAVREDFSTPERYPAGTVLSPSQRGS